MFEYKVKVLPTAWHDLEMIGEECRHSTSSKEALVVLTNIIDKLNV